MLPAARILGTKTDVSAVSGSTADFTTKNTPTATTVPKTQVDALNSLTLGIDDGTTVKYDQNGTHDLNAATNLYMFTGADGILTSENAMNKDGSVGAVNTGFSFREDTMEKELANQVKNAGHYKLEYINNGTDSNGMPEFFYIYRPFQVGYVTGVAAGNFNINRLNWDGTVNASINDGAYDTWHYGTVNDKTADLSLSGANAFAVGNAYLYTAYNGIIDLYGKLTEVSAAGGVQALAIGGGSVMFTGNLQATFAYNTTFAKAIGALQGSDTNGVAALAYYKVFADSATGAPYFVYKSADAPDTSRKWDYGVILNPVPNDNKLVAGSGPIAVPYADGTVGWMYRVFDATKNSIINNAVLMSTTNNLLPGDYVGISQNSNSTYEVSSVTNIVNGTSERFSMNPGYAWGYNTSAAAIAAHTDSATLDSYNSTNGLLTLTNGKGTSGASPSAITSGLIIAVNRYATYDADNKVPTGLITDADLTTTKAAIATAAVISKDSLANYNKVAGTIVDAGFVAGGSGLTAGGANATWVTLKDEITMSTTPDRYGIVLDQNGFTNGSTVIDIYGSPYITKQAYVYTNNTIVNVCAPSNTDIVATGNIVAISESQKITLLNPSSTYYIVSQVDNTLAHTGWADWSSSSATAIGNAAAAAKANSNIVNGNAANGVTMYAGLVSNYVAGASFTIATNGAGDFAFLAGNVAYPVGSTYTVIAADLKSVADGGNGHLVGTTTTYKVGQVVTLTADKLSGLDTTITIPSNRYNVIASVDLTASVTANPGANKPAYAAFTPVPDPAGIKGLVSMSNDVFAQNGAGTRLDTDGVTKLPNQMYAVAYVDNATGVTVSVTFIFTTFRQAQSGSWEWPWNN
ncbi:MAG: hypothetical protein FWD71_15480 [Oscillospiraceae bacterium]|nr:hypothetical protein [Oscillospiraceae bacterium]